MRILVKKGGPLTTLQDLGRYGYQNLVFLSVGPWMMYPCAFPICSSRTILVKGLWK